MALLRSSFLCRLTSLALLAPGILAACGGTNNPVPGGSGGAANGTGGAATGTGGAANGTGGTANGTGGTANGTGGVANGTGGTANGTGGVANGTGGVANGTGGGSSSGGSGPDVDQNGKTNASPGDMSSTAQDYLRLGEIRILNNNWGSEDLGCFAPTSTMSVFVNTDSSFGWTFNRGNCETAEPPARSNPDFPQVEFGIHPFGIGSDLVTSPEFSSTTLLPIQLKDVTSMSVTVDNLAIALTGSSSWNITFEFWVTERNPVTDPNPGVKGELMTFWGWNSGRWPPSPGADGSNHGGGNVSSNGSSPDQVSSDNKTYTLWVQSDNWASGWQYYQFRDNAGSPDARSFNGKVDVKPFIEYLINSQQYSPDWWISRLEVGSEIDDDTGGTVTMQGITFEVNTQSRSEVIIP